MSRVTYPGYRNGFPFIIKKYAQDGELYSEWDGVTFYDSFPSKSDSEQIDVYGIGTDRPLGFTLLQMSQFVWRVDEFTVSWTLQIRDGDATDYDVSGGSGLQQIRPMNTQDLRNESQIISSGDFISQGRGEGDEQTGYYERYRFGVQVLSGVAPQEWLLNLLWSDCVKSEVDGLYYPKIGGFIRYSWLSPSARDLDFNKRDYNFETEATLTIQDVGTFPLYTSYWYTSVTATGNMTIEPTKFWSYNGLYDTSNGNLIPGDAPSFGFGGTPIPTYYIPLI